MHAVALHFMYYNFVKVHQTLKVTPAMEACLTDRLWDITMGCQNRVDQKVTAACNFLESALGNCQKKSPTSFWQQSSDHHTYLIVFVDVLQKWDTKNQTGTPESHFFCILGLWNLRFTGTIPGFQISLKRPETAL